MILALLVLGIAALLGLALVTSMFVTLATTGGSAFEEIWPTLGPITIVLTILGTGMLFKALRKPGVSRSPLWATAMAAFVLVTTAVVFVFGVLA